MSRSISNLDPGKLEITYARSLACRCQRDAHGGEYLNVMELWDDESKLQRRLEYIGAVHLSVQVIR